MKIFLKNLINKIKKSYFYNCIVIIFKNKFVFLNYIFYQLKYDKELGYYLKKRVFIWVLISPITFSFYLLFSIYEWYYESFINYDTIYIKTKKRKLSFIEKMNYTLKLI